MLHFSSVLFVLLEVGGLLTLAAPCPSPIGEAGLFPGFCASEWASGLNAPRGLIVSPVNGDILVIESGSSVITALFDVNGDGRSTTQERTTLGGATGLNHGITYRNGFLYASSATTLYRWKYPASANPRAPLGTPDIVVKNMPCCWHVTRTPVFDKSGLLYVSSGAGSNIDPNSTLANIKRFNVSSVPSGGFDWTKAELFADGLRNEVGIAFDRMDRLWGVENGCDDLNRTDLGGDIHQNNPAEEMNMLDKSGKFYGYPYCWSEYNLPKYGKGKGTQWAHPDFINDGVHSDAWCQNPANVVRPRFAFAAHMAPLGLMFYYGSDFSFTNVAFVAFHGSWDRDPPQGYRVELVRLDANGMPTTSQRFFYHQGATEQWPSGIRPVALAMTRYNNRDALLLTSDETGQIIVIWPQ
jgi:glucose/arabinose dehydrogenase